MTEVGMKGYDIIHVKRFFWEIFSELTSLQYQLINSISFVPGTAVKVFTYLVAF